jgi:tetratricopeptide (TPR) repeat protein
VGRPERGLPGEDNPLIQLARRLRAVRDAAGQPSYRQLSAATHFSAATLARAASGQVLPSLEVTLAYVAGCGADGSGADTDDWRATWSRAADWASAQAAAGRDRAADRAAAGAGPAQLPPDTADFTGRAGAVEQLCDVLGAEPAPGRPGAVAISVLAGMGGVGKTALAVHVAHRLHDRFGDGQLFASLQGATRPLRPAEVLARFLRDLGLPDASIPAAENERAARYRTLLAGRRMLIVLDDARDAAQVRPLLPGSAGCGVLITSRGKLADLPGAVPFAVDVLEPGEAREMFTTIIGAERARAEPEATSSVLASCAGLPLAVRIAAGRLASRPGWTVAYLAARLADQRSRLTELTAGDLAVRASFSVSYAALPASPAGTASPAGGGPGSVSPARVFRMLGLAGLPELSLPAIAALAHAPPDATRQVLEALADAHLLASPAPDRYRLHDLLRNYAADLAWHVDSAPDRTAAAGRMLRWYAAQAGRAAQALAPSRRLPSAVLSFAATTAAPGGDTEALDWFETERASLIAVIRLSADLGLPDVAACVAVAMWGYFQRTPYAEDWLTVSQAGVDSARLYADDDVLSWLLNGLGQVHSLQERFDDARSCLSEALAIRRRTGDRTGEATIMNSLAIDLLYQERHAEALDYLSQSLAIHTSLGEDQYAGIALNNMGHILQCLRRYDEALDHLSRALAIRQATGDQYGLGITEKSLGDTYLALGRHAEAADHYQRARAALRDTARNHADHADVLCDLGTALAALGRATEAREAWQAALPYLDRAADPRAADLRARLGPTLRGLAPACGKLGVHGTS